MKEKWRSIWTKCGCESICNENKWLRQSSGIVLNEIIGQINLLKASPMNEKIVQSISFYSII